MADLTPYLTDPDVTLHQGDSLEVLRSMPDASVHMACTSPPFFGLRDYGTGTWEGGHHRFCASWPDRPDSGPAGTGECDCEGLTDCDHIKPTATDKGALARNSTIGQGPSNHEFHKQSYGAECGKCGARRIDSQIGLESSPDEWAARLVDVFREVRRVLRDDGTLWVECGDSYASTAPGTVVDAGEMTGKHVHSGAYRRPKTPGGMKPKDLIGQPWLLAFALRADGWFLRSCIIWSKPNAMPESVTDRPTTGHSYLFLFSKKSRYFYDAEGVREPHINPARYEKAENRETWTPRGDNDSKEWNPKTVFANPAGKNARTVWTIPTEPNALAICRVCDAYWQGGAPREHCGEPVVQHFAAFPRELVRRMILAGCPESVCSACYAPAVDGKHGNAAEPEAVQAELRRVRGVLRGDESEALLPVVLDESRGPLASEAATTVSELRQVRGDDAEEVLFGEVRGRMGDQDGPESASVAPGEARGDVEGREGYRHLRLRQDLEPTEGLSPGAPLGDGGETWPSSDALGVRPSSERDQDGQPPGELGTDDAQPASGNGGVSPLRGDVRHSLSVCCGAPLQPGVVLDPFSGSGTTLLVARSLGRHSVGIELNERYCAMTRARMSQLSLLSELA